MFALPGSRRNPAAAGCNSLLGDGAEALLDPGDLLIALGRGGSASGRLASAGRVPPTDDDEAAVMLALGGDPGAIDDLERNTGLAPGRLGAALGRLERAGRIQRMRGLWWPR